MTSFERRDRSVKQNHRLKVSLATVEKGDITPKKEFAQRLAIIEAIMGQFHGSVVVACLLRVCIGRMIRRDYS